MSKNPDYEKAYKQVKAEYDLLLERYTTLFNNYSKLQAKKSKLSTFIYKIKLFFVTIKDFIKSGFKVSDEFVAKHRLDTCKGCPFYNNKKGRCTECGCFMKIKTKVREAKCPKDYWKW